MDKTISRDCNVMMTGIDFEEKQKPPISLQKNKMTNVSARNSCKILSAPKSPQPIKKQIGPILEYIIDF